MKRIKFSNLPKLTVILHGNLFGIYYKRKRHLKGKVQSGENLHLKTMFENIEYNIIIDRRSYLGYTGVSIYDNSQLIATNLGEEE